MINYKLISLALALAVFTGLFVWAYTWFGSGVVAVYGDEYVARYFQRDKVMEVNIEIDPVNWDQMMANPVAEEFHTATVAVNGDVYQSVRIRTKGNSSLGSVAGSDSDRYSFKLNFNDIVQNQTMAGLTQLNLNNCFSDPSYMREYLSYQIFEAMGVSVPAYAYAAVYVNGEYYGLYLAVESILEPYLERNFGDITGDLYKSVGNTLGYNGDNPEDYTGLEVKSTMKNADWSKLIKMLEVLNNDGDIEKYLDVDAALKYIAVSTALVNFDSYQGSFGHNYYLYEQNGIFTILPWDLNMSFGGFGSGGDTSRLYIDEPTQGALADRPLIARLLADEEYRQTYHGYLEQVVTRYLSGDYLEKETARLFELIGEYVRTDPTAFYTYEQFERGVFGAAGRAEDESRADAAPGRQEQAAEPQGRGFPNAGGWNSGGNVPGILEFAATVSESIQKQLSGELLSTNNGDGMGTGKGMPGGMPGFGGADGARQFGGNAAPPEGQGMERRSGGMMMPQSVDMEAVESLRQEISRAGGLTDELRAKAVELDIPEQMLEMMARGRGRTEPGGVPPEEGNGGNRPGGVRQPRQDTATLTGTLAPSGVVIMTGITVVLFFKRRKFKKLHFPNTCQRASKNNRP